MKYDGQMNNNKPRSNEGCAMVLSTYTCKNQSIINASQYKLTRPAVAL